MTLPPLPPTPAGVTWQPGGRSVVDVLAGEHATIADLCVRLADPAITPRRRREIADVLAATVARHLSAEEQYLYPVIRRMRGAGAVDREIAAGRALRRALRRPGPEIARGLREHAASVEDMLAALAAATPPAELIRLGNRVEVAEEAAPTRPHPKAPAKPPWNKVADPALGVLDRLRDAFTGRRTRARDLDARREDRLF
ncbi:hemerythrin domain-containing protein [Micromonospora sp. CPCC 206061]|uniref:hemerythrin domain-containing protein n=1 Tax=Micromonospora sp. CPCC 206061 TaxID=3122410 RepID=UPI002FEEC09E